MSTQRYIILMLAMFIMVSFIGCSDDDDTPADPVIPDDPYVAEVVVDPESMTFTAIGQDLQFNAFAIDQNGASIDTVFTWQSSNDDVVVVDLNAVVVATGLGSAEIYVMAGSAVDTSEVIVTLASGPVYEWIAIGDGNWANADNWSDGEIPGLGDVAVISKDGDYTVTLGDNVEVEALVLGAGSGTQILDTNGSELRLKTCGLLEGGELDVSGSLVVLGDFAWSGGTITGSGQVEIQIGAELHAVGNPLELEADMNNSGTIIVSAGASLRVNELLECNTGALIELQGDAILTVQFNGDLRNAGTIRKSLGEQEAAIFASSAEFSSTGSLRVDTGTLRVSGGTLRGTVEIDGSATLIQSSETVIESINSLGDGPFVITGGVTIGTFENQIVTFRNIILDSGGLSLVSGPAALLIDNSFIWRRGRVHELGSLNTQVGSETTFENTGTSMLSATSWNIRGDVKGDSNVILALANGASINIEGPGRWFQSTSGTVSQDQGDPGSFNVIGEFHKTDEGAFVVETTLSCFGILNLVAGELTAQGDFNLHDTGVITGGGTEDLGYNRRLILIGAPSAVMSGTIRPGLGDGEYARMEIQGLVDLEPNFRVELDVMLEGAFNTESVFFLTGGQVFGGTLALNVLQPVVPGEDYKVIYSNAASEEFAVTGDLQFDEVIQNAEGVICRQLQ